MNKKIEKLIKSGKDHIIKSAIKIINEDLNADNFLIQVKKNKKTIIVNFHNPIVFVPLNSIFSYNYGADLIVGSSWSEIVSNPEGFGKNIIDIPVYSPTEETKKHIQFVINAVNACDEIGLIDSECFGFDDCMIIRDNPEYYKIRMLSSHQESFYKIDKQTGNIYDSRHAHLIPPPVFEDEDDVFDEI